MTSRVLGAEHIKSLHAVRLSRDIFTDLTFEEKNDVTAAEHASQIVAFKQHVLFGVAKIRFKY